MSRWEEQYGEHPFHITWGNLITKVNEIQLEEKPLESTVLELARLKKVCTFIDGLLQSLDPELIIIAQFNSLNTHATNSLNEINAFIGDKNPGHLVNANTHLDTVVHTVKIMSPITVLTKGNITSMSKAYHDVIKKYMTSIDKKTVEQETKIQEVIDELTVWHNEQSEYFDEINTSLDTVKQNIEAQTATLNVQFQESEQARSIKFDKLTDSLSEKSDSELVNLASKLGAILQVAQTYENNINKVLNVVVKTAQSGSYGLYATEEKKSANRFRYGAMLMMLIGVGFIVAPEIVKLVKEETYKFILTDAFHRAIMSFVMFVPAFYLAKESGKHRINEIKNRQRELVLGTIDPYLELMNDDKKQELKGEIAKRIFGDIDVSSNSGNDDTANIMAQMTNFVKQIRLGKQS